MERSFSHGLSVKSTVALFAITTLIGGILSLSACSTGNDGGSDATGTARYVTIGGIPETYEGGTATVLVYPIDADTDGSEYIAGASPGTVANNGFTAKLYEESGEWKPTDDATCKLYILIDMGSAGSGSATFSLNPIGSGDLALGWADSDDN